LYPHELYLSKSMQQVLRKNLFTFSRNTSFEAVIDACKTAPRRGQDGTWISAAIKQSYTNLHRLGFAHSFEAWQNGELAGGLYGVKLGKIFFGESMFSKVSNASKAAFTWAVQQLKEEGIMLVDCQVYTSHLESLGARFISRNDFLKILDEGIEANESMSDE
jgi:leucyl/phenylalanyl-tRNA--protein transferase